MEAEFGLGTAEALDQDVGEAGHARDLALDSGLLMQAGGAEVILAEQAYVTNGPRALEGPAQQVLELGTVLQSAYLLGLGDLLLAQSKAVPGSERQMTARLASVEARGWSPPDTLAQIWAVRALPRLLNHDLPGALLLLDRFADALVDHAAAAPLHQFGLWVLVRTIVGENDVEARTALRQLPAGLRGPTRERCDMRMRSPRAGKATVIVRRKHSQRGSTTCRWCRIGIDCSGYSPVSARSAMAGATR